MVGAQAFCGWAGVLIPARDARILLAHPRLLSMRARHPDRAGRDRPDIAGAVRKTGRLAGGAGAVSHWVGSGAFLRARLQVQP